MCLDKSWNIAPDAASRLLDESFRSKQRKFKNSDAVFIGKLKYPLRAAKKVVNGNVLLEFSTAPSELTQKEVFEFDSSKFEFVDKFLRNRIASGMERAGFSNVQTEHLKRFDSKFHFIGFDIRATGPSKDPISSTKYWLYTSNETVIISFTAIGKNANFSKNEISKILKSIAVLL